MVESENGVVFISKTQVEGSVEAIDGPFFIIKDEDKYYVTIATWEYDLEAAKAANDPELIEGCERIAEIYEAALAAQAGPSLAAGEDPTEAPSEGTGVGVAKMQPTALGGATRPGK